MDKSTKQAYLQHMGIDVWESRTVGEFKQEDVSQLDWDALEKRVATCTACPLHETRIQTVFGTGDKNADLMIIGEAPGANEDRLGQPFVGRAGKLLDSMLFSIGLTRDQVYIANVLKSRPPRNRDPSPEEVAACTPFLLRQIALVKPKLLLALGRISGQYLLKTQTSLGALRGQTFHFGEQKTPLFVTYHPAYLLRAPKEKRKALDDLLRVKDFLKQL